MTLLQELEAEINKAKEKHPDFPLQQGVGIIAEELGELAQVMNDYMSGELTAVRFHRHAEEEAFHVAVTALRFIEALRESSWPT